GPDPVTRDDLTGHWRAALFGMDLLFLEPVDSFSLDMVLRDDGSASWRFANAGQPPVPTDEAAPFGTTWEMSDPRTFSVWVPVPPHPLTRSREWTREEHRYPIVWVSEDSLTVVGPFGGN